MIIHVKKSGDSFLLLSIYVEKLEGEMFRIHYEIFVIHKIGTVHPQYSISFLLGWIPFSFSFPLRLISVAN